MPHVSAAVAKNASLIKGMNGLHFYAVDNIDEIRFFLKLICVHLIISTLTNKWGESINFHYVTSPC